MNFKRADRVAELIRAEMADIIIKEVKRPTLAFGYYNISENN